ncbi:hypothetical protein AM1_4045 [Acaryochloris marina MBIC11017]|uniref:Uncharacterized protein n=1 Tax=Acaryochloris marina (strain MBIC 11017) TaxID=329726 RepID=B0CAG1_ACAM1|nr:hypothetical protein AM1_4045 [Acaryochloris marina MBIC11017]
MAPLFWIAIFTGVISIVKGLALSRDPSMGFLTQILSVQHY